MRRPSRLRSASRRGARRRRGHIGIAGGSERQGCEEHGTGTSVTAPRRPHTRAAGRVSSSTPPSQRARPSCVSASGRGSRTALSNPFANASSCRYRKAVSVLHMPARTLARRRQTRKLDADESDRLYRIARVAAHAFAVFGAEDKAATWLRRPNRALNGELPIDLLEPNETSSSIPRTRTSPGSSSIHPSRSVSIQGCGRREADMTPRPVDLSASLP